MKKIIKSFPKFSGLLTAGSNKITEIGAAGGRCVGDTPTVIR